MSDTKTGDGGEETTTLEEAIDAGYFGIKVDPEPNEVYTFNEVAKAADVPAAPAKATTSKTSTSPSGTTSTGS